MFAGRLSLSMTVTTQCMRKGCTTTPNDRYSHPTSRQDNIDDTQHHPQRQPARQTGRQPRTSDMDMWMERGIKTDTARQTHATHRSTNTHTCASISRSETPYVTRSQQEGGLSTHTDRYKARERGGRDAPRQAVGESRGRWAIGLSSTLGTAM